MEYDAYRRAVSADNVPQIYRKTPRAAVGEMPFRSNHNHRAGVHCGVHSKLVARLGSVGLFGNDVQSFRADLPAVFGAVVFPVGARCTDL